MFVLPEILLISIGVISLTANIILVLVILISGRTPTHLYIMEVAFFYIAVQFLNPIFQQLYVADHHRQYDVQDVMTVLFFFGIFGIFTLFMLLHFMDYFRWIHQYKFIVMPLHASILVFIALFYYFVVENLMWLQVVTGIVDVCVFIVFLIVFLLHRDLECLKKRLRTDDESRLRYLLLLTFFVVNIVAIPGYLLETFVPMLVFSFPILGLFSLGFAQLQPLFFVIVLFKVDHRLRSRLVSFFKMCSFRRDVQLESIRNDDGRLINQSI